MGVGAEGRCQDIGEQHQESAFDLGQGSGFWLSWLDLDAGQQVLVLEPSTFAGGHVLNQSMRRQCLAGLTS